MVHTREAT